MTEEDQKQFLVEGELFGLDLSVKLENKSGKGFFHFSYSGWF